MYKVKQNEVQNLEETLANIQSGESTVTIVNDLTTGGTTNALSAEQGKVLKTSVDGKANTTHTHTKSQITDFPKMTTQANSTASDVATLVTDFNALLAKLKSAGLMA